MALVGLRCLRLSRKRVPEIYGGNYQAMAQLQAGNQGNPRGMPEGVKGKRTGLRVLLQPRADALAKKAVVILESVPGFARNPQSWAACRHRQLGPGTSLPKRSGHRRYLRPPRLRCTASRLASLHFRFGKATIPEGLPAYSSLNPTAQWLPSQKGLFLEAPQRQRV
jgi:hypothetical protein